MRDKVIILCANKHTGTTVGSENITIEKRRGKQWHAYSILVHHIFLRYCEIQTSGPSGENTSILHCTNLFLFVFMIAEPEQDCLKPDVSWFEIQRASWASMEEHLTFLTVTWSMSLICLLESEIVSNLTLSFQNAETFSYTFCTTYHTFYTDHLYYNDICPASFICYYLYF